MKHSKCAKIIHMHKAIRYFDRFFDKLEDKVRGRLSHSPIMYGFLGGFGIVLFWRGTWHIADDFGLSSLASLIIGTTILLMTGLFSASFIGDQIIISGLKHEKRLAELTEEEVETERDILVKVQAELREIKKDIEEIKHRG